ncbi:hypothetical protein PMAYCL1PPCAC_26964, partial [Pristionchus mayeri]
VLSCICRRVRHSAMDLLDGAYFLHYSTDPMHLKKIWRGIKVFNEGSNHDGVYYLIPIKVVSARYQGYKGTKWVYEVLVGESECPRGTVAASELSQDKCTLKEGNRWLYKIFLYENFEGNFEKFLVGKGRSVAATEQF